MVRAKNAKDASFAPGYLFDSWTFYNYSDVDSAMKEIDNNLLSGNYGYVYYPRRVDVLANEGLLYIDSSFLDNNADRASQYNTTVDILQGVYTGKIGEPKYSFSDYVPIDNHHVSSVSMRPISASLKSGTAAISDATKAIWDHINNYHQPVVVVVDSNKQAGRNTRTSDAKPTLHYIVIRGIYEDSSGGTRHFWVHDPAYYLTNHEYTEADLRKLMALPDNTPAWVQKYGKQTVGSDPAYILTVQGD